MTPRISPLVVLVLGCLPYGAAADRGMMPFDPNAQIYEPKQDAIIAWNGREEILLLSTELHASTSTRVLEVLPLPAEPRVEAGDARAFKQLKRIIERRLKARERTKHRPADLGHPFNGPPPARIAQRKRIGAHRITVVELLDAARFVAWVERFLEGQGVKGWRLPPSFRRLVELYIKDGFRWFVFDVVSVEKEERKIQPIRYRFRTDYLFYPLRISSLARGATSINLALLTPRRLVRFPRMAVRIDETWTPPLHRKTGARSPCVQDLEPLSLTAHEVRSIGRSFAGLLGSRRVVLDVIACEAELSALTRDLVATW